MIDSVEKTNQEANPMNYRQLQTELKAAKAQGQDVQVRLNASRDILQAEYDRLQSLPLEPDLSDLGTDLTQADRAIKIIQASETPSLGGLEADLDQSLEALGSLESLLKAEAQEEAAIVAKLDQSLGGQAAEGIPTPAEAGCLTPAQFEEMLADLETLDRGVAGHYTAIVTTTKPWGTGPQSGAVGRSPWIGCLIWICLAVASTGFVVC